MVDGVRLARPAICRSASCCGRARSWRKGLGRNLLQSAEPVARQHRCESLRIETHPGNIPMLKLMSDAASAVAASCISAMRKVLPLTASRSSYSNAAFSVNSARVPAGVQAVCGAFTILEPMSNGTREKQALGVFLILIVLSTFGIAWYMVAGHSWNVAASSIDEKVGQMEGYTSIVYAGTLPVQADARTLDSQNGFDAQLEEEVGSADAAEKADEGVSGSGAAPLPPLARIRLRRPPLLIRLHRRPPPVAAQLHRLQTRMHL